MNAAVHGFLPGTRAYRVGPGRVRRLAIRPNVLEVAKVVTVMRMSLHPQKCLFGQVKCGSVFGRLVTGRQSINPKGMPIDLFGCVRGLPVAADRPKEAAALLIPHLLRQKSSADRKSTRL